MSNKTAMAIEASALVEQIKPPLTGRPPAVQGAVLCDLLAIWLASHRVEKPDGTLQRDPTDKIRDHLLQMHLEPLPKLVKLYEDEANER